MDTNLIPSAPYSKGSNKSVMANDSLTSHLALQIVLATNIAETAVTIDDCVCVINSGRVKEKSYDPYTVRVFAT